MKAIVKEYDAFISYRHSELDSFVAERLHKELENFRLPKYLAKQKKAGEKTRITRVFRDREELPIAANLSKPIQEALENSEFLIVICTPRLRESVWCQREIETFIQMHGREHVLAVLAEGEPRESFPEMLQREVVTEIGKDGVEHTYYRAIEPLAADVRGKSKKEIAKKIKQEVLRLAAPIFSCAYDDLRQRHREQKLKKRLQLSMAISAAMLIFGSVCLTQALQIRQQSKVIETQYQQNLKSQSEILSTVAMEKLKQGDRIACLQNALEALPQNFDNPERPVVPEAIYALTSALRVYDNGVALQPDFYLEQTSDIDYMLPIGDGYLFTIDAQGKIWIWDVANQKVVALYQSKSHITDYERALHFQGTEAFYMLDEDCVNAYGVTEEKVLWTQSIENPEYLYYNSIQKEIFVAAEDHFYILDNETGEIKKEAELPSECKTGYTSYVQKSVDGKQYYVVFYYYDTGSVILTVQGDTLQSEIFANCNEVVKSIKMAEDGTSLFAVMNVYEYESGSVSAKVDAMVINYSLAEKTVNWEYHTDQTIDQVYPLSENKLVVQKSRGLAELDTGTGMEIRSMEAEGEIENIYTVGDDKYQLLLNDGSMLLEMDDFSFYKPEANYSVLGNWFEAYERMDNYYLTLEYDAKRILVYDIKVGENARESTLTVEEVTEKYGIEEGFTSSLEVLSETKKQCATVDVEQDAILFQTEDGTETKGTYSCSASFIDRLIYSPDGDVLCVVYSDATVDLVDTDSFECIRTLEDLDNVYTCENIGSEYFALIGINESYVFERENASCIAQVAGYLAYDEKENVFYISSHESVYTVPFYSNEELVRMAKEKLEQ